MDRKTTVLGVLFLALCISITFLGCSQNLNIKENNCDEIQETTNKYDNSETTKTTANENDSDEPQGTTNENDSENPDSTVKTQYGSMEYYYTDDISKELNYLLYVPNSVDNVDLPLIIYLHGGSGRGDDLSKLMGGNSLLKYVKNGSLGDVRAYVLAPQCPANYNGWAEITNEVLALIEKVTQENAIDKSKIILTGNSMGGAGTWNIALKQPELFSCIVPMSGKIKDSQENRTALAKTPIWAFVGENDTVVNPIYSINFCEGLKNINPEVKCTVFENAEHSDVLKLAWLDKEIGLLDWMLSQ